jgi:phage terminase large subunit-like protein
MIEVPDTPVDGYGRLLPIIAAFRGDGRYTVHEVEHTAVMAATLGESRSITISGPSAIAEIEKRFRLPADLAFQRQNKGLVWLVDGGVGITFRSSRNGILDGWRALEWDSGTDETAGDHSIH